MAKYRFEQIAINSKEKKKPAEEDRFTYIGLEHLDTGSLNVTRFGSDVAPIGEKLVMRKGDVLFGKRRAYQKKVAIAPFDGIFSAHGMVLRPQEKVVDRKFFPLFISSDYFLDAAIKISVGSLSPTINWRDLKDLEFELPDLDTQKELAEVLWAINDTIESYKKLISVTDELVKSQFIEMIEPYSQYSTKAGTIMYGMRNGLSPSRAGEHYAKTLTLSAVTQGVFDENAWKDGYFADCPPNDKRICATDFYICRGNGNKTLVGAGVYSLEDRFDLVFPDTVIAARINEQKIRLPYLYMAWKMQAVRNQIEENTKTTNGTYKINQSVIANVELVVPPLPVQDEFVAFVQQSDKSKFAVLDCLKRNLLLILQKTEDVHRLINQSAKKYFCKSCHRENHNG